MISQFLHEVEFELSINTSEIDQQIKEMKKVKTMQIGTEDKLMHVRWIVSIIATMQKNMPWVVGTST